MKFSLMGILAFVLLVLSVIGPRPVYAGPTWMPSGVGVGSYPNGGTDIRVRITGTATSYVDIWPSDMWNGDCFTRPITATSTTLPYLTSYNGFPVLAIAAAASTVSITAEVNVPIGYGSGGTWVAVCSTDVTDTAMTLRADVLPVALNVAENGSITTGTAVPLPDGCINKAMEVSLTNASSYIGRQMVKVRLFKTAGSTGILYIRKLSFRFKPDYWTP